MFAMYPDCSPFVEGPLPYAHGGSFTSLIWAVGRNRGINFPRFQKYESKIYENIYRKTLGSSNEFFV